MNWPLAFVIVFVGICQMTILGVTAYAVFWLGYSGWWFLLAVLLLGGSWASVKETRS